MSFADLHTHTTASDGIQDPAQLVELASQTDGLGAIAITDHDSLESVRQLASSDVRAPLDLLHGVEITTSLDGRAVHMLGYFVDLDDVDLEEFLRENRQRRANRAIKLAERLHDAGLSLPIEEAVDAGTCVNRPLLARLLVDRGIATSMDDAFARFLGSGSPYYVDVTYPDAREAIELVRAANGYAFVAHPARSGVVDLIDSLASAGMHGLEAYHTRHAHEQSAELEEIARHLGLGVSGGSDWHGDERHASTLGAAGLDESAYRAFLQACDRA